MTTSEQPGLPSRGNLRRVALAALALAIGARVIWILAGEHNFNFVDLRVYYEAAHRALGGTLYDFYITEYTPQQPLPFTYPPFAALCFYPLKFLPFTAVAIGWVVLTAVLLFVVVRMCLAILLAARGEPSRLRDVPIEHVMLWTAAALWIDPVRTNLDYGQVNVLLMTLGVGAAYLVARSAARSADRSAAGPLRPSGSDVGAGALVGIAAGIKLTPAVGGLFLLARGRPWAAAFSAVGFGATVAVSYLLLPAETRRYFTVLLGDTGPIGYPAKVDNQSLRGALSRFVDHDLGTGPAWMVAVAIAGVVLFAAWWVVRKGDALIALVLVQLFGLLASPISWIHHWVWVVPLLIWLVHGPLGRFGGLALRAPGAAYTPWATGVAIAVAVIDYIGVHYTDDGLELLGLNGGPLWAVLLAQGVIIAMAVAALILALRTRLQTVGLPRDELRAGLDRNTAGDDSVGERLRH